MKPENLLVFKDLKVKIGDFRTAMKMHSDNEHTYFVSGLTQKYAMANILNAFKQQTEVTKKDRK